MMYHDQKNKCDEYYECRKIHGGRGIISFYLIYRSPFKNGESFSYFEDF